MKKTLSKMNSLKKKKKDTQKKTKIKTKGNIQTNKNILRLVKQKYTDLKCRNPQHNGTKQDLYEKKIIRQKRKWKW